MEQSERICIEEKEEMREVIAQLKSEISRMQDKNEVILRRYEEAVSNFRQQEIIARDWKYEFETTKEKLRCEREKLKELYRDIAKEV